MIHGIDHSIHEYYSQNDSFAKSTAPAAARQQQRPGEIVQGAGRAAEGRQWRAEPGGGYPKKGPGGRIVGRDSAALRPFNR